MRGLRHGHAGTRLSGRPLDLAAAEQRDATDPLRSYAEQFHHPTDREGRRLIYLAGHSLGLAPTGTAAYLERELADWQRLGVLGHHEASRPWIGYHERLAPGLARLTGAGTHEVVAMNSLTVNLHLMMVSFFRPSGARNRILIEQGAFPSDRYAVVSQLDFHGLPASHLVEVGPRPGERTLRHEDLLEAIERHGRSLALVLLPGVQYLTGQALDIAALSAAAQRAGALVGWDLAHAIGNLPLSLHADGPDFAVWCSYKYLNAGPGAVGGCFVHERHGRRTDLPRFAGWWGHDKAQRFLFEPGFQPIPGAEGWQLSNPPILASAPLLASLELFDAAGVAALRTKSLALSGLLRDLIQARLAGEVEILTPAAPAAHGCQLSLRLRREPVAARRCHESLTAHGIIADWREPDVVRLAPVPLYNAYSDAYRAVMALEQALRA